MSRSLFEGATGLKKLVHVQSTFERFAVGVSTSDMHINQDQFQRFCEEMGLVNEEMSRRLFLAMDDDNTGAMEAEEFLAGIRLMCDDVDTSKAWLDKRIKFAFMLFDLDREETVDQSEIKSFLKTFYTVGRGLVEGWVEQFERMFGAEVAVLQGQSGQRIRWRDEPGLMRTMKALEDKMERERDLMSEAALNFRESKEESGIRLAGFHKWCTTENDVIRLRILDWLKHIGNQWLERMSLSQAEREGDATPLPRSAFRVAKNPGLRAKFAKITMEDFEKVFDKYAQHGQMSEAEFDRALSNMGVTVPYLRKRFFAVFDDSESGFIEVKEFMAGFQLLMQDDRDKKLDLAFKMFDIEGNGYVSESEMRRFLSTFFRVGEEGAQAVIHDFESLFGPDKKIAEYVHSACRRLAAHYLDVVMKNIFESQKLAAPGPGGQRRLFITDFKLWSAQNGDRVKDWLDSLGDFWLASIDKTVRGIDMPDTTEAVGIESDAVVRLVQSIQGGVSATERKAKLIKQPGYFSGAPKIPPPNCSFSRQKVKFIQELFIKISQDGAMGPPEWKRCLRGAGIFNEVVSERLFTMFDTSGDKQMNAKEFTWGLSDICSEESPPGISPRMTADAVRRAFAYRYYDQNGQGYFEMEECRAFLKSWVSQAEATVRGSNDRFMQTYGLDRRDLELVELPHVRLEQERLARVRDAVDTELERFVDDVYRIFAPGQTRMNYDHFTAFTEKAPIVVDWLTELGKYLDQQFPKLAGMNFEEDEDHRPSATELSVQRMKASFKAHSNLGVMTEAGFEQCLKSLGPQFVNKQFSKLLFRVVDLNKNGSLTSDEFVDSFTTIISGSVEQKLHIAFQLHDVQGKGYLDRKSLRMFFISFFGQALDEVNILARSLDQWINGQQKDTDAGFKHAEREKGLPSHYFIGEARKLNLELAVNVRKAAAGQVSMLVDQMVDHAMRYASVSEEHLYTNEFSQWMSSNTKFVVWMESLGKAWMVTKQQKQQELAAFASAVGGGGEPGGGLKPARGGGAQRAPAAADAMQTVIKAGDVGKTVGNVVKTLAAGETPYPGGGASAASGPMTSGPGGTWWNRAFTNRSHAARTQVRPRTHFDYVTLADVALVFQKEIASGRVYTKPAFRQVMRDGLRFENALVSDRLYSMFDVNGDGNLDAEEVATGLVLMVRGTKKDRLKLAFSFFDAGGDGSMMKHEMRVFLRAFARVSSEVVTGLIESLAEAFGPVAVTGMEVVEMQEFKEKVSKAATKKLDRSTDKMVAQAFASDVNGDNQLSWDEFSYWAEYQPQFSVWLQRLGIACLEAISPLEDRNVQHAGQRPVQSTYRVRRKFPLGTQFDKLRVSQVRNIFMSYSTYGKLGVEQFATCLNELHVHSPHTVRRLFMLFDRDVSGDVMMREFASGFFLLCGGSYREKLGEAFNLFDLDGNGYLHPVELEMLLDSFFVIAMDVVCSALSITTDILQPDAQFDHMVMTLSAERVRKYINKMQRQLEQFCARDNGKYYFKTFYQWADQNNDFLRWLESLRNMWLESIIEYEASPGAGPHGNAATASGPPRAGPAFPTPAAGVAYGPQSVYGYRYTVKKTYSIGVKIGERLSKRLNYTNPYKVDLRLTLHTDSPEMLHLPKLSHTIGPMQQGVLRLSFEPRPQKVEGLAEPQLQIRLWIHNEGTDENEECIIFNLNYLTAFETSLQNR